MVDLDIPAVRKQLATLAVGIQADAMARVVNEQERGEYFIPDTTWVESSSDTVVMLNRLLHILLEKFPTMEFAQYENLRPSERGILIKWRPRYGTSIPKRETHKEYVVIESPKKEIEK